jgi:hypothetical protein
MMPLADVAATLLPATLARPGIGSLLVLCVLWEAVTWGACALTWRFARGGAAAAFRASLPAVILGRLGDGLLMLCCALLFWSLGGSWSTAGAPQPA